MFHNLLAITHLLAFCIYHIATAWPEMIKEIKLDEIMSKLHFKI